MSEEKRPTPPRIRAEIIKADKPPEPVKKAESSTQLNRRWTFWALRCW